MLVAPDPVPSGKEFEVLAVHGRTPHTLEDFLDELFSHSVGSSWTGWSPGKDTATATRSASPRRTSTTAARMCGSGKSRLPSPVTSPPTLTVERHRRPWAHDFYIRR